eukprot:41735-Eustigmatos_ZCMA.PRE.1
MEPAAQEGDAQVEAGRQLACRCVVAGCEEDRGGVRWFGRRCVRQCEGRRVYGDRCGEDDAGCGVRGPQSEAGHHGRQVLAEWGPARDSLGGRAGIHP